MNYYEHHIGDYDKNTAHLSACEDGIYCRLLRRYYDKEAPLEADVERIKRWARARTEEERAAVDAVLAEFFWQAQDGRWHHDKADAIIAAYKAGEPERQQRKVNEETRTQRHRRERSELFAELNAAGEHMAWNCPIADLRAAVQRLRERPSVAGGVSGRGDSPSGETAPVTPETASNAPVTATQTPDTRHHLPDTNCLFPSEGVPAAPPPAPKKAGKKPKEPPPTRATWEAYAQAYQQRYGTEPVRNATVNGMLATFVSRLPQGEAPDVARYYVELNEKIYVERGHAVRFMVQDAETLHMRWKTKLGVTLSAAPVSDRAKRALDALPPSLRGKVKPAGQEPVVIEGETRVLSR